VVKTDGDENKRAPQGKNANKDTYSTGLGEDDGNNRVGVLRVSTSPEKGKQPEKSCGTSQKKTSPRTRTSIKGKAPFKERLVAGGGGSETRCRKGGGDLNTQNRTTNRIHHLKKTHAYVKKSRWRRDKEDGKKKKRKRQDVPPWKSAKSGGLLSRK